jgi:general secretion pathway protein G
VKSGFTLVEILIVVIILGILAAIVIPQFTNASQDARKSSLVSQLQTLRSQLELYKLQHLDKLPTGLTGGTSNWAQLTTKSNADGTTSGGSLTFGPYMQSAPTNPLNNSSSVKIVATDATFGAASGSTADGFILNSSNGKVWATSTLFTKVYDESNPANPANDQ